MCKVFYVPGHTAIIDYARQIGAYSIGLACNADAALITRADLTIIPVVGPEVLSGSTRIENSNRSRAASHSNSAQSNVARSSVQAPVMSSMAFAWVPSAAHQLPTSRTRYSPMNPG